MGHPCARAAKALDEAGFEYELEVVPGYKMVPWTWPSRSSDRAHIRELTGQEDVPVLDLGEGEVVQGGGAIERWARETARAGS